MEIKICLQTKTCVILVRILNNIVVPFILGIDALNALGFVIDYAQKCWSFANGKEKFGFETVIGGPPKCNGIAKLLATEEDRLKEFLSKRVYSLSCVSGVNSLIEDKIDVGGHAPIRQRAYAVSPKVEETIEQEVDRLLEEKIIEPSASGWSSPIVMIKKAHGKYRFCLDFRKVNEVSRKDGYPLPLMTGILDKLRAAKYISMIDLSQAYFQIPLKKNSREITATMIVQFLESNHREWDLHLAQFRFAYNTAHHSSLQTTPAFVNFGRNPWPTRCTRKDQSTDTEPQSSSINAWTRRMKEMVTHRFWFAENLDSAAQEQAKQCNAHRRYREFIEGDLVLRRNRVLSSASQNFAAQLAPKYQGDPYETYILEIGATRYVTRFVGDFVQRRIQRSGICK